MLSSKTNIEYKLAWHPCFWATKGSFFTTVTTKTTVFDPSFNIPEQIYTENYWPVISRVSALEDTSTNITLYIYT